MINRSTSVKERKRALKLVEELCKIGNDPRNPFKPPVNDSSVTNGVDSSDLHTSDLPVFSKSKKQKVTKKVKKLIDYSYLSF